MTAALGSEAKGNKSIWQRMFPSPTGSDESVMRAVVAMVRLLPQASRPLTAVLGCFALVGAVVPLAFQVATAALVGAVPAAVREGPGSPAASDVTRALVVVGVAYVLMQTFGPIQSLLADSLGRRLNGYLRTRIMRVTSEPPGIGHLEDPVVLNHVVTAQAVGTANITPRTALVAVLSIGSNYLHALIGGLAIAWFRWWLPLVVIAAHVSMLRFYRRAFHRNVQGVVGGAEILRRSAYFRDLALTPGAAKETRVFGLGDFVVERFSAHWTDAMRDLWKDRSRNWPLVFFAPFVFFALHVFAVGYTVQAALDGELSLARFVFVISGIGAMNAFGNLSDQDLHLHWGAPAVTAVVELDRHIRAAEVGFGGEVPVADRPQRTIEFRNVSFAYPGRAPVFSGLDLSIPVGSSLAIVGDNGAGKTTFVKLLARLYEPKGGEVLVDGTPLGSLRPAEWQRRVSAIFQDFTRYQLSARENVSFGAPEFADDHAGVEAAAARAGASSLVAGLPFGWDTILSRQFKDGADLSGGQWQRLALARALFAADHGAQVLILDEPTASLDVRAEAEIYDRFLELTKGLTTVVISHRFSTVRRADRIVVIEHGAVVEDGTHDELMRADGRYARMFRLQAARFTEAVDG